MRILDKSKKIGARKSSKYDVPQETCASTALTMRSTSASLLFPCMELSPDCFDDFLEGRFITQGDVGEYLAVQKNLLVFEALDESRVFQFLVDCTQSCIQAGNPKGAEVALAQFP